MPRNIVGYEEIKQAFLAGGEERIRYFENHKINSGFFPTLMTYAAWMAAEQEVALRLGSPSILLLANETRLDEQKNKILEKTFIRVLRKLPLTKDFAGFHLASFAAKDAEGGTGNLSQEVCNKAFREECSKVSRAALKEAREVARIDKKNLPYEEAQERINEMYRQSGFTLAIVAHYGRLIVHWANRLPSLSSSMTILEESYVQTSQALHEMDRIDIAIELDTAIAGYLPRVLGIAKTGLANLEKHINEVMDMILSDGEAEHEDTINAIWHITEPAGANNPDYVKFCASVRNRLPSRPPAP